MTKCIVIGKLEEERVNPKRIEFTQKLMNNLEFRASDYEKPQHYDYLELICKDYTGEGIDLIFGYKNPDKREQGIFFAGHWNDGII